jgi:hypothetical protein
LRPALVIGSLPMTAGGSTTRTRMSGRRRRRRGARSGQRNRGNRKSAVTEKLDDLRRIRGGPETRADFVGTFRSGG